LLRIREVDRRQTDTTMRVSFSERKFNRSPAIHHMGESVRHILVAVLFRYLRPDQAQESLIAGTAGRYGKLADVSGHSAYEHTAHYSASAPTDPDTST
jgi:hypothetical protein